METEIIQAREPTLEELANQAEQAELKEKKEAEAGLKTLDVQDEIANSWTGGLFVAREERDDSFFNNVNEVVGTAIEGAEEQIVRSFGNIGDALTDWESDSTFLSANAHYVWGEADFLGDDFGFKVPFTDKRFGMVSAKRFKNLQDLYEIGTGEKAATLSNFEIADRDRPDSPAGLFGAEMVKWFAVFAATRKAMGGQVGTAGQELGKGMLAGAVTDFAAFDPHEERLSNMLKNIGDGDTVFNNAITEYLAMDETDSAIEGRLKQAIEGLGIGAVSDGLFAAAKWLRIRWKHRSWRKTETETTDTGEITDDDLLALDEAIATNEVTKDLSAADQKKVAEKVRKNVDEQTGEAKPKEGEEPKSEIDEVQPAQQATPEDVAKADVEPELHHIHRSVKDHMKIKGKLSEADILKLSKHIQNGEMSQASEMVNFNDARIDWDSMDDADSIQQLFYAFEDVASDMLKEGADGPVTLKMTKKIAEDVGYTGENAEMLFGTLKESGGITARMFAAHQAMVASARHLRKLAMKAKKTGAPQDMHNMHRHVELHAALMAQVKGSQSEIARALSAMRMMKDATAESWKEFDEVKRVMGGHKDTDAVIDSVLAGKGDLRELNKAVAKTAGRKVWDVISEIAINGLLSSPKTHVINLSSNAGMLFIGPIERYIAAGFGVFSRSANKATFREANAAMMGQIKSVTMAFRLAAQAAKEGRPISDLRQRIEFDARKAIKMGEGDNIFTRDKAGDGPLAVAINTIGEIIRIPGRGLLAGDEFFKTINHQAELHAQAYRQAAKDAAERNFRNSAARNKWIKGEIARHVKDPSLEMQAEAVRFARRQTFQENAETGFGPKVEAVLNYHPAIKLVVAPFVRTPMNLLRQSFVDRNPLLFAFVKKNRETLERGGPEAQAVLARLVTGTGAMMAAYGLVGEGILTGKGEKYSNTEKLDKIPEYSIKVGDRYYQYNRLDPFGSVLGLVADLDYVFKHGYDPNDPESSNQIMEFSQAVGVAFLQNALNKTWMASLSDILETATRASEGGGASAERQFDKFVGNQLTKLVPYSSAIRAATQTMDPVVREAWDVRDRLWRILPGLSEELPPQRDLLGRPITRTNAEWFWINPFGANPESDNPVDRELAKLEFDATIIDKKVHGVPLDARDYSELKRVIGDLNGEGPTLEQELAGLFAEPSWNEVRDPLKVDTIKKIIRQRTEAAKRMMLADPVFRNKYLDVTAREISEKTGEDLGEIRLQLGL